MALPTTRRGWTEIAVGAAQVLAALLTAPLLRRRYNRWGALPHEVGAALPGDELVPAPRLGYTRAITVDAPVEAVWPWLVQIGQGRGGLYSFDALENLFGFDLHSADTIRPDLQEPAVGERIRLAATEGAPAYEVERIDPPTTLVLLGGEPAGPRITWQWQLRSVGGGRRTRLLVRQRLDHPPSQTVLWRLVEPVAFVMEQRMLRGLARRAEGRALTPSGRRPR
ncbi:hypothetical protein [Petropleomorpha daqingensis]|uniref:Polyketide cyclase / dehydrase and lipid transport n=1 Tax=Petropleomorpha daqingensis TaxID=2026353 RepID=A0A853CPQ1_9ACTN|nr:hypothetical protein [Petropleomorpha daqingensis]NYJ08759.1 hypothetical protein [Petropleomorpha daqingensis]